MKTLAVPVISLAFSCLLPLPLGQVHQYSMPIVEKGTSYYEQIEIYENRGVEIFRVPAHNDVDAADFYHDFNMRVTVTKVPTRMACYIAKMDPSMPSPGKLKADIDQAASQASQLPVTSKEYVALVTGPADSRELTKEILDFCGALPVYKTENSVNPIKDKNGILTLIKKPTRRLRRQLPGNFTSCLGHHHNPLKYLIDGGCLGAPQTWKLQCRLTHFCGNYHYYTYVQCTRSETTPRPFENYVWICEKQRLFGNIFFSYCCDPIC